MKRIILDQKPHLMLLNKIQESLACWIRKYVLNFELNKYYTSVVFYYLYQLIKIYFQDVDVDRPDERSVMTYVAQFVHKYPKVRSNSGESIDKIQQDYNLLLSWLTERTQYLSWPQNFSQDFSVNSNEYILYLEYNLFCELLLGIFKSSRGNGYNESFI